MCENMVIWKEQSSDFAQNSDFQEDKDWLTSKVVIFAKVMTFVRGGEGILIWKEQSSDFGQNRFRFRFNKIYLTLYHTKKACQFAQIKH